MFCLLDMLYYTFLEHLRACVFLNCLWITSVCISIVFRIAALNWCAAFEKEMHIFFIPSIISELQVALYSEPHSFWKGILEFWIKTSNLTCSGERQFLANLGISSYFCSSFFHFFFFLLEKRKKAVAGN